MNESQKYLKSVEGLRSIAVFGVILFHLEFHFIAGGFVGVDVFFVISGFLISRNILNSFSNKFSFLEFYKRRIFRLVPASLVTIIASLIIASLLFSPAHLLQLAKSAISATLFFSNIHFHELTGYFDTEALKKPLLHFWSLSVEEQFYFMWPLMLYAFLKTFGNNSRSVLAVLAVFSASFLFSQFTVKDDQATAFFLVHLRAWEFLVGALLALKEDEVSKAFKQSNVLSFVGFLLVSWAFFTFSSDTIFPGANALFPCVGALMLLVSNQSKLSEMVLGNKVSVYLGKISYSLYLVHWPVWVFFSYWKFSEVSLVEKILLLVVIFMLAFMLFECVESRYRITADKKVPKSMWSLAAPFLFLTICSIYIISSKGVPGRVAFNAEAENHEVECEKIEVDTGNTFFRRCVYGDIKSNKNVLLIGDSHAGHLGSGINYLGKKHNFRVEQWTFAGCPPIWGTYKVYGVGKSNNKRKQENCKKIVSEWELYVKNSDFDLVVLSSRWMWLYESMDYGDSRIPRRDFLESKRISNPVLLIENSRQVFYEGLLATIRGITATPTTKVVVFSQVPLLAKNIQDCDVVPKILFSDAQIKSRCDPGVSFEAMMNRLKYSDFTINSLNNSRVLSILPSEYLCDKSVCKTTHNGLSIYLDDNHLNTYGSLFLAKLIENEFVHFMRD